MQSLIGIRTKFANRFRQRRLSSKVLIAAFPLLFVVSLALPAIRLGDLHAAGSETHYGFSVLTLGWLVLFWGEVAWFANGLALCAWVLLYRGYYLLAVFVSLLGVIVALDTFRFDCKGIPGAGASCCTVIAEYYSGTYVWFASLVTLFISALVLTLINRHAHPTSETTSSEKMISFSAKREQIP